MNYRTIWISDLHLGTRGCDAVGLLDFIKHHDADRLYLVGDVIDLWQLRRHRYWPQTHNDVLQKLLRKARKGTPIILIPGNHDEFFTQFAGVFGNIVVRRQDLHTTAAGQRLLVMHGHEFDTVTMHARWLAHIGDAGYALLLKANRPVNCARRLLGLGHWSLSAYVKRRVKNAVNFVSHFEAVVTRYAHQHGVDGIVCGHIHTAACRALADIQYYNCGDWVESSTALVEHRDGRLELLRWREHMNARSAPPRPAVEDAAAPARLLAAG